MKRTGEFRIWRRNNAEPNWSEQQKHQQNRKVLVQKSSHRTINNFSVYVFMPMSCNSLTVTSLSDEQT
jgi:hypothetical protein